MKRSLRKEVEPDYDNIEFAVCSVCGHFGEAKHMHFFKNNKKSVRKDEDMDEYVRIGICGICRSRSWNG